MPDIYKDVLHTYIHAEREKEERERERERKSPITARTCGLHIV